MHIKKTRGMHMYTHAYIKKMRDTNIHICIYIHTHTEWKEHYLTKRMKFCHCGRTGGTNEHHVK